MKLTTTTLFAVLAALSTTSSSVVLASHGQSSEDITLSHVLSGAQSAIKAAGGVGGVIFSDALDKLILGTETKTKTEIVGQDGGHHHHHHDQHQQHSNSHLSDENENENEFNASFDVFHPSFSSQLQLLPISSIEHLVRTGFEKAGYETAFLDELRFVITKDNENEGLQEGKWMTEMDKIVWKLKNGDGRGMMDITENPAVSTSSLTDMNTKYAYPSPKNSSTSDYVHSHLLPQLSTESMEENLAHFSSFRTRYYRSQTGREAQLWLLGRVEEYAQHHSGLKIREVEHSWGQNSIVARFSSSSELAVAAGTGKKPKTPELELEPIVIVGAHLDSTNFLPFLPAPGADDDGSGSTSILEAFRVLSSANYTPAHGPVEFHWYSAEEGGLLGSQAVAREYKAKGEKVKAMIQMDMTAWVKKGTEEVVGVITDYVDPA